MAAPAGPASPGDVAVQGPATPSWKGLGGGRQPLLPRRVARGLVALLGAQPGSPGWFGERDVAAGQACGTGLCKPGWGPQPGLSPRLLRERPQPLPGNVLAGGTRASKQTDAGGGWEKGRKPLSLCPLPPRHGGARGERGTVSSPQPPARSPGKTPTPNQPLLGAGELRQGTPRPRRLCREDGGLPEGRGGCWATLHLRATGTREPQRSHLRGPWQALDFLIFF